MNNFKLKYFHVAIPGESFNITYLGEDDRYIYGTVANDLLTTFKFSFGDLVKYNKITFRLTRYKPLKKDTIEYNWPFDYIDHTGNIIQKKIQLVNHADDKDSNRVVSELNTQ